MSMNMWQKQIMDCEGRDVLNTSTFDVDIFGVVQLFAVMSQKECFRGGCSGEKLYMEDVVFWNHDFLTLYCYVCMRYTMA